jgi:hypothetical protein
MNEQVVEGAEGGKCCREKKGGKEDSSKTSE